MQKEITNFEKYLFKLLKACAFFLFEKNNFYYNKTLRNTGILKNRHKCFKNVTIQHFPQSIFILV